MNKMENGTEKINRILANLSSTQEDMLALKDYIWLNLDHSSVEEVQTAASFLVKYLELLDQFAQNSQEISALISQFTGVQIEETPKEVEKNNSDNQRLIKELNKNTPHEVTEDFTFKRPTAFIFDGCAYTDMNCWSELFIQFVACLAKKDPAKLKTLADNPEFISKQNKKYYSSTPKELRKPGKIMNDFFVETNRSANDLMKLAIDLLNYFEIPLSNMTIYLRQDRNA